ncbi:MAG: hypothetical protein ABIQ06_06220 [Caldimonas sp.]
MSLAWICSRVLITAIPAVLSLTGCSEKDRSDGSLTATCRPATSATGREMRLAHPGKPSECKFGVILYCNACVYDDKGGLSHTDSAPCGACFGTSF